MSQCSSQRCFVCYWLLFVAGGVSMTSHHPRINPQVANNCTFQHFANAIQICSPIIVPFVSSLSTSIIPYSPNFSPASEPSPSPQFFQPLPYLSPSSPSTLSQSNPRLQIQESQPAQQQSSILGWRRSPSELLEMTVPIPHNSEQHPQAPKTQVSWKTKTG